MDHNTLTDSQQLEIEVATAIERRIRAEALASEQHAADDEAAMERVKATAAKLSGTPPSGFGQIGPT